MRFRREHGSPHGAASRAIPDRMHALHHLVTSSHPIMQRRVFESMAYDRVSTKSEIRLSFRNRYNPPILAEFINPKTALIQQCEIYHATIKEPLSRSVP